MKVSPRQLYFFLAAVAPAGKLVLMPSQLAAYAENDLLFPALVQIAVQAALVFAVLLLARDGRTVYAMLADMVGSICAKIVCILFAAFLLFAALVPLIEQKLLVQSLFYDTLPSYIAFLPFFLFSAYVCARRFAAMGRAWDVLAPLFLIGLAGILLFAAGSADFGALAPVGRMGGRAFGRATATATSWFFDAAILLPLVGHMEYRKGMAWKGALFSLGGGAAILLFLAMYYAVFSDVAVTQLFAFSQMSKYFSGVTAMGRVDYLFIFAVAFVMTFFATAPIHAAADLIAEAFGRKKPLQPLLSVGMNGGLLACLMLVNFMPNAVVLAITERAFWVFPIFTAGIPIALLLALICKRAAQRRRYAVS